MITVRDLVKRRAQGTILDRVTMTVGRGEVAAIIGPSGGGKSTLLRCINGLERFEAGEVGVEELCLRPGGACGPEGASLRRLRGRVGMVFQQFNLFPHMTALENVLSGPLYAQGRPRGEAEAEAEALLRRVGLAHRTGARPPQLSGGEQQRVAIARALAVKPAAVLFDEPTSALDPRNSAEVLAVMEELAATGLTMLVVTHAMSFARRAATTVHVMHAGQVIESGPPGQVFDAATRSETQAFLADYARERTG
jgi:ABC-type polar amino acid transport system ATPase subunit